MHRLSTCVKFDCYECRKILHAGSFENSGESLRLEIAGSDWILKEALSSGTFPDTTIREMAVARAMPFGWDGAHALRIPIFLSGRGGRQLLGDILYGVRPWETFGGRRDDGGLRERGITLGAWDLALTTLSPAPIGRKALT